MDLHEVASRARRAGQFLAATTLEQRNEALAAISAALVEHRAALTEANASDLAAAADLPPATRKVGSGGGGGGGGEERSRDEERTRLRETFVPISQPSFPLRRSAWCWTTPS